MKKFCEDLKRHVKRIIDYEKKEMIPLTKKRLKPKKQKKCYICNEGFSTDDDNKKYHIVRDHCHYTGKYRGAAHCICNLRYQIAKEIPVVFFNGSTYDYHLTIKELTKKFEGEIKCLGENTEKYITFSVPITTEITKTDMDGNDKITKISYKIKFIDSFRFMDKPLSSLVDNLSEGVHSKKCADCKSHLDYMLIKIDKLILRFSECKKNYEKEFNKELIKRFKNTFKFCDKDINKFILLLRKRVYPYEYMDNEKKFDEKALPDKEAFIVT